MLSEHEQGFRRYLTSINITPQIILQRYQAGKQTIVFDFVSGGSGLASFLYLLKNWAHDEEIDLKESLVFLGAITYGAYSDINFQLDYDRVFRFYSVRGKAIPIDSHIFFSLGNSIDEGELSDRLVPEYLHGKWTALPEELSANRENIGYIYSILKREIDRKEETRRDDKESFLKKSKAADDETFFRYIQDAKEKLNIHRNPYGMFSPNNILQNICGTVPWDSTTSYREFLINARERGIETQVLSSSQHSGNKVNTPIL